MTILSDAAKAAPIGVLQPGMFSPVARYHAEMDIVQYLKEDCSYRAERVDGSLTLLWHPYEDRLVGIALKGFRFLFQRVKEKYGVPEEVFLPLVNVLQAALEDGAGEEIMEEAIAKKRKEQYAAAKKFVANVALPPEEFRRAA